MAPWTCERNDLPHETFPGLTTGAMAEVLAGAIAEVLAGAASAMPRRQVIIAMENVGFIFLKREAVLLRQTWVGKLLS